MVTVTDRRERAPLVAVGIGAVLVVASIGYGLVLRAQSVRLYLGGPLLAGSWQPRIGAAVVLPVTVAVLVVLASGTALQRMSWTRLVPAAVLAAAAWAVSLALVDGASGLTGGLESRHDYLANVDRVHGWGEFLSGFVAHVPLSSVQPWTTHVGGHPPGALLSFVALDQIGLGGPGWAATLCIGVGASAVAAVLIATRSVAGEFVARTAAPFLVLTPAAIWLATSADAYFLGVSAWGVASLAVAAAGPPGRRADAFAAAGGLLLGFTLFLSYGLVLLAPVALAVVAVRRQWRVLLIGALAVAVVFALFAAAGFWWFAGLSAGAQRVNAGAAAISRPTEFFLIANLAAAAIAIGPAGVGAIGRLATRAGGRTVGAVLPLAALAGVLVADVSLLSKGEVERIYLPFFAWILTATALLQPRWRVRWLAAQAATALAVQLLVRTSW